MVPLLLPLEEPPFNLILAIIFLLLKQAACSLEKWQFLRHSCLNVRGKANVKGLHILSQSQIKFVEVDTQTS